MRYKSILSALLTIVSISGLTAQKRTVGYRAELGGAAGADRLPFWQYTNTYGRIAPDSYLWGSAGFFSDFRKSNTRKFDFSVGVEGTGALGRQDNKLFINQLFGRIRWQNLVLDLGVIDRPVLYDGLSSTNGDLLYSNNSRSMPGICLSTWDFIKLPWIGKWVAFQGKYAEYIMNDNRYMGNRTRLHNKLLAIRLTPIPQLNIEGGIEDYAQWGGTDPERGKLPHTFKDYLRLILVKAGGEEASWSDQYNKMGNHIGRFFGRIRYGNENWQAEINYNHMFEDGSGQRFQNGKDGLYGIYFSRRNGNKWFKSFLYEFQYTKSQSGASHQRPATEEEKEHQKPDDPYYGWIVTGGNDNYFNHGEYHSGWTLFGNTIGSPFFSPRTPVDGITYGIYNSRFTAHHWGVCGNIPFRDMYYKLMCSYSQNYGIYSEPFPEMKSQVSFNMDFTLPESWLPFHTTLSLGFDKGDLLGNKFGVMLKIFKTGLF